jgi:hypothetical protein
MINPLVTRPNPHPKAPTHPLYPLEVLQVREHILILFLVFTFKRTFEYFKEFGGASKTQKNGH